ncbi:SRPBCC family protein [Desertibaculum subflavum]|uniref:SRPBCC family protein n=1 Tax=Desertibaculum subflavum TaxID=2268458 RepID=UPI000E66F335
MHLLAEFSIVIEKPPAVVFAFAADLARFGQWFPGVVAIHAEDTSPPAAMGKRYRETVTLPLGGRREIDIVVVDADPGRRLVTEGEFPPLLPRMEMRFDPAGSGDATLFDWRMYSRGATLRAAAMRVPARALMQGRAEAGLAKLKALLEAEWAAAPHGQAS